MDLGNVTPLHLEFKSITVLLEKSHVHPNVSERTYFTLRMFDFYPYEYKVRV